MLQGRRVRERGLTCEAHTVERAGPMGERRDLEVRAAGRRCNPFRGTWFRARRDISPHNASRQLARPTHPASMRDCRLVPGGEVQKMLAVV